MSDSVDEQTRYAIFRKRNGRCQHCGARLKWEEFGVRGRGGSWALEMKDDPPEDLAEHGQALCFKCVDFPGRNKNGKLFVLSEG